MKVSVIISNYNYGRYLPAAIAAVLAQSYQNFEIIVVDDGSTDDSRDVLTQLKQQAPDQIHLIFQTNQGQGAAFNAGFAAATGEIIAFLDADDTWKPEKLQHIVEVFRQSDAVGVMHYFELMDAAGNPICDAQGTPISSIPKRPLPRGNLAATILATGNAWWFPPTSALSYRRSVLEQILPMNMSKWRICADGCLVYCTAFLGNIIPLNQVLAHYRLHDSNNFTVEQPSTEAVMNSLTKIEMTNQYLNEFLEQIAYPERIDLSRNLQYRRTRFYQKGQWNISEVMAISGLILTWCFFTWQERLYYLLRFWLKSGSFLVRSNAAIGRTLASTEGKRYGSD